MIGERIKRLRLHKGMTQTEVCLGICNRSLLSKVENGSVNPSIDLLEKICTRLGVRISEILDIDSDSEARAIIEQIEELISDSYYEEAIKYGHSVMKLKIITGNNLYWCECLKLIGLAHHGLGQYEKAKDILYITVDKSRGTDSSLHLSCVNALAATLTNMGEYNEALSLFLSAYDLSKIIEVQHRTTIRIAYNIANLHRKLGAHVKATKYLNEALRISKRSGIYEYSGHLETMMGLIYLDDGKFELAIGCFQRALNVYIFTNNVEGQIGSYINISETYLKKQNINKAREHAELALELLRSNTVANELVSIVNNTFVLLDKAQ